MAGQRPELHYPVGLDLGGDTPQSVALAIVSEIAASLNHRNGGMLKHRTSTIHEALPAHRTARLEPEAQVRGAHGH